MIYVFDTSAFVTIFKNYYKGRFPSLWRKFDRLVEDGRIVSTMEVRREIEGRIDDLSKWLKKNKSTFPTPTSEVAHYVRRIFEETHFQHIVEQKKILKGGYVADPFVVATAASLEPGSVVTLEGYKKNGAKIPNICEHFDVPCLNLEDFMKAERWKF
jgi:hypothetical protein